MPRFPPHVSKPTGAQLSGGNERMEGGGQEPGAPGAGSLGKPGLCAGAADAHGFWL